MTISTTESSIAYTGNGVTLAFAVPFRFLVDADLTVTLRSTAGVESTLVLNTNYTLTGANDDAGGTLTMVVAPAVGERLVISRVVGITQETDYITGDNFPAEAHERALDRLTMISQQQESDIGRSIQFPVSDTASPVIPTSASRANKFLSFDASGNATVASGTALSGVTVSALGETLVGRGTAALMRGDLGASAVGDTVFTAATAAIARTTLDVPARAGTDATGTWPIGISGTAATATNIAGGGAGQEPYQSGSGTTSMLAAGTPGQIKQSNGAGAPSWVDKITLNSSVATTSGTSVTLTTAIPSTAKRVTLLFKNVSTNGSSPYLIQGGSGSFDTSGYSSTARQAADSSSTAGFIITTTTVSATSSCSGKFTIDFAGSNDWMSSCNLSDSGLSTTYHSAGIKTFSGTLDRLRITTVGGADTFDAGSIVVTWE